MPVDSELGEIQRKLNRVAADLQFLRSKTLPYIRRREEGFARWDQMEGRLQKAREDLDREAHSRV